MVFKILQTTVVLALCLLASARPQMPVQLTSAWSIGNLKDWADSGNYRIYSCSSQAAEVKNLLDLTYLYVQTALLSTNTPAYKAFFRSADPAPVETVLRAITAGTSINTKFHGVGRPTLVCANAIDPGIAAFWNLCKQPSIPMIMQPEGTSIIFLCPIFFRQTLSPQATQCGIVNHAKTRMITQSFFPGTQYGALAQTLADMYIKATMPGVTPLSGGLMTENECLALPPDQAVRSSSSYAYFLLNVRAGCTHFPTRMPIHRDTDRELLETDGINGSNGTAIVTVDCGSNGANSSSCSV